MIAIEAIDARRVLCRTLICGDRGVVPMQLVDLTGESLAITPFVRETAGTIFCDAVVVPLYVGVTSSDSRAVFTSLAEFVSQLKELDTMAVWRFVASKKIAADASTPAAEICLVSLTSINRTTSGFRC